MAYIAKAGTPINDKTFANVEDAIAAFTAPMWAGAPVGTVEMISDTAFKSAGNLYEIHAGENPKAARREAALKQAGKPTRYGRSQHARSSAGMNGRNLTAKMNNPYSDY